MQRAKKKRLELKGWKIGTARQFLNLSKEKTVRVGQRLDKHEKGIEKMAELYRPLSKQRLRKIEGILGNVIKSRRKKAKLKTVVRRVGKSLGITFPRTIVENYNLKEGDVLHVTGTAQGFILIPLNAKIVKWAKLYARTNRRFRKTLNALE